MPSPCSADMRTGSPRPKDHASIAPESPAAPSALLTPTITLADLRRKISAKTWSEGVTPVRPSIKNKQTSAISTARSVKRRMRPCKLSSVTSSSPAVSITVKRKSNNLASPSRRSRVTPGWSSTSASLRPTRRLKSVDLPTLGRPTIARVKVILPSGADPKIQIRLLYTAN